MREILLAVCLLISASSFAQDTQKVLGRWKLAAMYDEAMYYDIGKDSLVVLRQEGITKQQLDTMQNVAKAMMKELFKDAYFEFREDMTYKENSGMQGERNGTYSIDEVAKVITVKRERKSKSTGELTTGNEKIPYTFKGNRLVFTSKGEDDGPNFEFEKQ